MFSQVKKEPNGKSRGFGFVRFKNADASKAALAQAHKIGGRICEVRNPRTKVCRVKWNDCHMHAVMTDVQVSAQRYGKLKYYTPPLQYTTTQHRAYCIRFTGNMHDFCVPVG